MCLSWNISWRVDVGSACVDDVLVYLCHLRLGPERQLVKLLCLVINSCEKHYNFTKHTRQQIIDQSRKTTSAKTKTTKFRSRHQDCSLEDYVSGAHTHTGQLSQPVNSWTILLEQGFTDCVPLLMATNMFTFWEMLEYSSVVLPTPQCDLS